MLKNKVKWVVFLIPALVSSSMSVINAQDATDAFKEWVSLLESAQNTHANQNNLDSVQRTIEAYDGTTLDIFVLQPDLKLAQECYIPTPSADVDATPYVTSKIATCLAENKKVITFSPGTYNFKTLSDSKIRKSKGPAHLYIEQLQDVSFIGRNVQFIFHQNAPGILIQQSQRVKFYGFDMAFQLPSKSIVEAVSLNGSIKLKTITGDTSGLKSIYQIAELDAASNNYLIGGKRFVYAPDTDLPTQDSEGNWVHNTFKQLPAGKRFVALHFWYGGQAIKVDGDRDGSQTEDLTFEDISIYSTPGMAITITGLKRGFALINSKIGDAANHNILNSPSWDALNAHLFGGDLIVSGNTFYGNTDDAININHPIHTIKSFSQQNKSVVLQTSSRFIIAGDRLSFFDDQGGYLATSNVIKAPKALGGAIFELYLDELPVFDKDKTVVRNLDTILGGYSIDNNNFENISGHAILAQTLRGSIQQNDVKHITRNAFLLLSSPALWKEGVGAIDVSVVGNVLDDTGYDFNGNVNWSAISAYAVGPNYKMPDGIVNSKIRIADNKISGAKQGCVSVSNTTSALIKNNACTQTLKNTFKQISITNSTDVTVN